MVEPTVDDATVHWERGISPVWLVPLIAVLVAAWLGIRSWNERGEEVVINFASAAGIVVNKTELRYKDVRVGVVRRVELSDDLHLVKVSAELVPQIADKLSANSRFWVVSPKISASGVTGLSTLISGVYIGVDPGDPGTPLEEYQGSLTPIRVDSEVDGKHFKLRADSLGSIDAGSPIYYREVPVGEVLSYALLADGSSVAIDIFVRRPFDQYVHSQSRFWNVSGIGVDISDRGVSAHVSSLTSLVAGGIAFDTPENLRSPEVAVEASEFLLYPNLQAVRDGVYTLKYFYQLNFSGSVRGLNVGAAVEFRGIQVGEVVSIRFAPVAEERLDIEVLIAFEPQRLHGDQRISYREFAENLENQVARGLKAQLKVGNLLTGALFVDLVFAPDSPGAVVKQQGGYPALPTADAPLDQVSRQITEVLDKVNGLPIEQIGRDLGELTRNLNQLSRTLAKEGFADNLAAASGNLGRSSQRLDQVLAQTDALLQQLQHALGSVDASLAPDSPLIYEVTQMARAVSETARSLRLLSEELNRKPNALIFGKENP